jgi:hypothetical protein
MRHLWSLIAGLVIAPLAWLLLGYSNGLFLAAAHENSDLKKWLAVGLVVVAALIAGFITSLRMSPLGPVIAGLLLTGVSVITIIAPKDVFDALPALPKIGGIGGDGLLAGSLANLHLLIIGVIFLVGVFSAGRWRSWPEPVAHPSVGPVNPMVDTGRIEAIKGYSPDGEPTEEHTAPQHTVEVPEQRGAHSAPDDGESPWAAPPTNR